MNTIHWIDEKVLVLFTTFSHWFQRLTGKTNFFLAKCCLAFAFLAWGLDFINYYFPFLDHETPTHWAVIIGLIAPFYVFIAWHCDKAEEAYLSDTPAKPLVLLTFEMPLFRLTWLAKTALFLPLTLFLTTILFFVEPFIPSPVEIITHSVGEAMTAFHYFIIVTPLPPKTSKIKEFLNHLLFKPKPVPVPSSN